MSDAFTDRMTKSQVVEQIRCFNVSAPREWLESFSFSALQGYLDRLRSAVSVNHLHRNQVLHVNQTERSAMCINHWNFIQSAFAHQLHGVAHQCVRRE